MKNKVVICGVDTSTLPHLTQKQSKQLLQKIAEGDKQAREEFINCNMKLVLSVVQRYADRCDNLDDLFQIGCVGLIKSVDNFNVNLGLCFSTYAVPMIIGEIRRYLREGSIRVSRGIRDVAYHALQTRESLENKTNSEVTVDQIAQEMKLPTYKVVYCLDAITAPISLSQAVYSDEEDCLTLQDTIMDKKQSENNWLDNISLFEAMSNLEEKEKDILFKRYFLGKTQMEVSDEVGLSQAQVSRLEKTAVQHLRSSMDTV